MGNRIALSIVIAIVISLWVGVLVMPKNQANEGYVWTQHEIVSVRRDPPKAIASAPNGKVCVCFYDAGIYTSSDHGKTWKKERTRLKQCSTYQIVMDNHGTVYARTGVGCIRSSAPGKPWQLINNGLPYSKVNALTLPSDGNLYATTRDGMMYISSDRGDHWKKFYTINSDAGIGKVIVTKRNTVYAYSDQGILFSKGKGEKWGAIKVFPSYGGTSTIDSDGRIFVFGFKQLEISDNNGQNWKRVHPSSAESTYCYDIAVGPNDELVAGTDQGLLISKDHGLHWIQLKVMERGYLGLVSRQAHIFNVGFGDKGRIYGLSSSGNVFVGVPNKKKKTER